MSSIVQQPLVYNNSNIKESVIAAFDIIQNLANRKHIYRLLLRFAYIYLVRVIDIYRAAAAKDRVKGQVSRGVGQRDITVTINIYLAAKKKDSKEGLSRTQLLDYYRRGKQ
jgi:carbohydrate-binding DOMON domain-containing protein